MHTRTKGKKRTTSILLIIVLLLSTILPNSMIQKAEAQISEHVVISQVFGGGGNANALFTHDFIELYNPTNQDVSLDGWSVQYTDSKGTKPWEVTPLVGTIEAHGYFLIAEDSAGNVGAAIPTADVTDIIKMTIATGKVALVKESIAQITNKQSAGVVDFVGYGAGTTEFEGTGPTTGTALTSKLSAHRISYASMGVQPGQGNGWDTDDNSKDFVTKAPNPRNTKSPKEELTLAISIPPTVSQVFFQQSGTAVTVAATAATVPNNAVVKFYGTSTVGSGELATTTAAADGSFMATFDAGKTLPILYITTTEAGRPESASVAVDVARATDPPLQDKLGYNVDKKIGTVYGTAAAFPNARISVYADSNKTNRLNAQPVIADAKGNFTVAINNAPDTVYVAQQNYTAKGIMLEGATSSVTKPSNEVITDISTVRLSDSNGHPVNLNQFFTIEGVVTIENGILGTQKNNYNIQDATAGINILGSFDHKLTIKRGDKLRISGRVIEYNGLTEFEPTNVERIAEDQILPTSKDIKVVDMTVFATIEPLEGSLVTFSGKVTSSVLSGAGYNVTVLDENSKSTLLRVMTATKIDMEKDIVLNKSYTFTGIVGQYSTAASPKSGYQLLLRDKNDIAPVLGITHTPITQAYEDTIVSFEAFADGAESVTLYYRKAGDETYTALPMLGDGQGRYTTSIQSSTLNNTNFEYYMEAKAGESIKSVGSSATPYPVSFEKDKQGPTFLAEIPGNTARVESPRPEISIVMEDPSGVDKDSIEILVDGIDVKANAILSFTQVKYTPTVDLAIGNHEVKVTVADTKGNVSTKTWTFEVVPRFAGGHHYRGTTHNHTVISHDAKGSPEAALLAGKNYGYDYFAFSDHSHDIDPALLGNDTVDRKGQPERTGAGGTDWKLTKDLAKQYTKDGKYVVFPAFEMTSTTWGHSNVFGTDNFIDRNINGKQYQDLSKYYAWVLTYDNVVAQFNHPDMSANAFNNFKPYDKNVDKLFTMLEVGNGSGSYGYANAEGKLFSALDLGWHVAPTYGEDNHDGTWGKTNARTVIVADDLTQESLLHSMSNMRVYMSEDPNFQLDVLANGFYMGSTVDSKTLNFTINGQDPIAESKANGYDYLSSTYKSDDRVKKVELISNGGKVVDSYSPNTVDFTWKPSYTVASGQQWFVVRVTQMDGERIYSAPIWSKEESVDVKVNSIDIVGDVVIDGNPATAKVTVGNFGTSTVNNLNVDLYVDVQDPAHKLGSKVINSILAKGTGVASITWDNPVAGDHNLIAVVTSNDGANLGDISFVLPLHVKQPLGLKVLIDAQHGNENSTGDSSANKDNLKAFTLLLQKEGYKVEENKAVITSAVLQDVTVLVITQSYTAFTTAEEKAVGDFVKAGGSVLFAGKSNNGTTDSTRHNGTLAAIGTQIRMSHDGVFDDSKTGNFWSDPLVSKYAVRAHPGLVDNYVTDRVPFIDYYSGSSLQAVGNTALNESGKVKFLVRGNETTYQGNVKNSSFVYDDVSDDHGGSAIPLIVSDEIGAKGRIIVSGMNMFNDKQMDESFEPKGNSKFIFNAVNWLAHRETKITNIEDARKLADETPVVIQGTVTTAAGVFFDAFYVQDATGGIMAFNEVPAGSLKLGDTVRIYGHIKTFENNKEIEFTKFDIDVIKTGKGATVAPKEVTTGTATSTVNQGLLVKVKGKVTSKYDDTSYVINDGSGNLLVFTDGYIENQGIPVPQLKVGDTLEAVGLSGEFSGGSRIRVRDTKELEVTPGMNDGDPVVVLEVDKKSLEMTKGYTVQLQVKQTTTPENGEVTVKDVTNEATYEVVDESIASVTGGVVTANASGTTSITIKYEDKTITVQVKVYEEEVGDVIKLEVDKAVLALKIGESVPLTVKEVTTLQNGESTVEDVTNQAKYEVTEQSIATVTEGIVTANALGMTIITIEYKGNTAIVQVVVSEEGVGDVDTLIVDKAALALSIGDTVQLTVKEVTTLGSGESAEEDVTNQATYEVGDNNIATVTAGLVTAIANGSTTITIKHGKNEVVVNITVKDNPDDDSSTKPSITSQPRNAIVNAGGSTTFAVAASNANKYQWQVDMGNGFTNLQSSPLYRGVDTSTLIINGALISMNGYMYRVVITNNNGSINSNSSVLKVNSVSIPKPDPTPDKTPSNPAQPKVEEINIDVVNGASNIQTLVKRITELNGIVKDIVTFTTEKVKETIEKLKQQNQDTAKIVIPDKEDKVNEVSVTVPKESLGALANGKANLEIFTANAHIYIPKASVQSFGEDLFIRVVPLKEQAQKNEVEERAKKEKLVQLVVGNKKVNVLGRPMEIETNMQNRSVVLTLPIPTNATKEQMDNLAIFIEHSDGTKEVIQGKLVEFEKGIQGMQFTVNKFSTFTIMYMEGAAKYFAKTSCAVNTDCLQVNKTTPVYVLENNRLKKVGEVVKGQSLPVKQAISPMLGLGGNIWLERTAAISYETPSKEMIAKNQLPANKRPKQIWKGLELTPGQIGKVTILQDTVIWESIDKKTKLPRIFKKGEQYRVYRYVPGMYQISDQQYIIQDSNVVLIKK
ncbi:CehA/McbA family metallohydrolase [Psychrobacillus sp. L3]|uniref:CehA/McbA family metallohydrolase n=1 Tax=Psychrobacillus sp. L3 TaxID=3236891 RepID=UPI0036F21001